MVPVALDSALNVGDGTTGENTVNTGTYNVTEAAAAGTSLADYTVTGRSASTRPTGVPRWR